MLSVLAGHKRYSHVTAIRCDGVNPGLLGMNKVISEDALRNALKRLPEAEGCACLGPNDCGAVPGSASLGFARQSTVRRLWHTDHFHR